MTRIFISLFGCLLWLGFSPVNAQPTDPDPTRWINYRQSYVKIPIAENGIYRITASELRQVGVPVDQLDPATLQLFHRGVEQAIFVAGETDSRFGTNGFLEFYGRGNDGVPDSLLYRPVNAQPHRYYSLFSDTTAFFLTWQLDGQPGKRMAVYADTTSAHLTADAWHWAEELRLFTENYPGWAAGLPDKIEYSQYEAGEGYTGPVQQKEKPFSNVFQLTDPARNGPNPQLDVLLVGRDYLNHRVDCLIGSTDQHIVDSIRFAGYTNARMQPAVTWNDADTSDKLIVSTVSRGEVTNTDAYSVSYIRLRYPQKLTSNGRATALFRLQQNPVARSVVTIANVLPNTRFWDVTDPDAPVQIRATTLALDSVRLVVRGTDTARTILAVSEPKRAPALKPIAFTDWTNRKPTYLIISHDALIQPVTGQPNAVRAYAAYRASTAGGSHDTLIATMSQLFDQYSYGERHPLAIRRFAAQMLRQGKNSVQYLLLIGRARSTPGIRRDPQQATLDMVMTAGFPGSDGVFTAGLNSTEPDVPAIPTGRINAGTPQEVLDYLNKVKEYEQPANAGLWRKNLLHLSGGQTTNERVLFRQLVDSYRQGAIGQSLGARVTTISKRTNQLVEPLSVAKPVNDGVGLITFFGHSGLDVTDLDIGFCSSDGLGYRNTGKYPLLLINGCAIGNFFFGRPTLATDWVLTPNRGAIAAIAQSHLGYVDVMHTYTTTFYNLLTDSTQLHKSIGQLQQETMRRVLAQTPDGRTLANAQQMVLQGDPAIRLFPATTPDYMITANGMTVSDTRNQPLTILSDSVQIRAVVQNTGQYRPGRLPVRVRRVVNGQESGVFNLAVSHSVAYRDTLTLTFPNDHQSIGQNQFELTINPDDLPTTQPEINHTNNQATTELVLSSPNPVLIYPPDGSVIGATSVRLSAQYMAGGSHRFDLEIDSTARFDSPFRRVQSVTATQFINYPVTLPNRPNTTYFWRVRLADTVDGAWSTASFTYAPDHPKTGLPEGQIQLVGTLPTDVQQGDVVSVPVEFVNLSPYAFTDSLLVRQTIYAAGLANPQTKEWRVKPLAGTDIIRFTTVVSTDKLPGTNRILLTINPRLQPEYSFLNNTLDVPFFVHPDTVGPLLDVAFDGARITNDAVVSARPMLDILVADENRSLIQRDTTGLDLFLQRPGQNAQLERLRWRTATVLPIGATNAFRLRYPLPALSEGTYQLRLTARDVVGNSAMPYKVRFRVINDRQLTHLRIYPNPFRDQTLFAFTLTGDQPPESVTVQINDLTGRVVRILNQPARIGLNEWPWDGRSDEGSLLPAGVYVYEIRLDDAAAWPVADSLNSRLTGRLILLR